MFELKDYYDVNFPSEVIKSAYQIFFSTQESSIIKSKSSKIKLTQHKIDKEYATIDDLLYDYDKSSSFFISSKINAKLLIVNHGNNSYKVTIDLEDEAAKKILQIFDDAFPTNRIDTITLKGHSVEKTKTYYLTKFFPDTIQEAYRKLSSFIDTSKKQSPPNRLTIYHEDEHWSYSSYDEFFAEYNNTKSYYIYHDLAFGYIFSILGDKTHATVSISSSSTKEVQSIFQIFERDLDKSIVKIDTQAIRIFIGHGQSDQWKSLKDHLHEKHGFDVIAYELGTRAGYTIQEVLKDMLGKSSLALLVLTGDDLDNQGRYHARENVIHELGLFQGKLGFKRAIALKEDGVTEFSNIEGLNQIRFSKNNIRETFGDVLALIKDEYSQKN